MQRSESDALSYVFVPGYAVWPCIKNELSHPLLRTFFGFAIFGAPPTCAAGLPLSPLSQQLVSGKQQATIIWRMTLSHHGMALDLTFRPAPTRTTDLTHVVLLQDAVPNTDRLHVSEDGSDEGVSMSSVDVEVSCH